MDIKYNKKSFISRACFIAFIFFPTYALAQYCVADQSGNIVGGCYGDYNSCNMLYKAYGQSCMLQQPQQQQQEIDYSGGWNKNIREMNERTNRYNQAVEQARNESNPKLLPLASNIGISRDTEAVIMNTLNHSLEFDSPNTTQNWINKSRGSSGTVTVYGVETSQYGAICRTFQITLEKESIQGSACRDNGRWVWQ